MSILPETHTDQMYSWFPLYIPIQTPMYIVCSFLDAVVLFILRTSLACLFGERRTNPKYNECDTLQKHRCGMNGAWTLRSRRLFIIRMENTSGLDCKKWIVLLNNYMFCFVVFSWLYNCTHTHLIVLFLYSCLVNAQITKSYFHSHIHEKFQISSQMNKMIINSWHFIWRFVFSSFLLLSHKQTLSFLFIRRKQKCTLMFSLIYLGARYSPYTTKVHSSLSSFLPFHNHPFFSRMMSWRRKTLLSSPSLPPPLLLASTSWLKRSTLLMLPNLLTFTWLEPPPSLCSVSWQSWSVSSSKRYSSPCFPHSPVHCQNVIQASLLWYFLSLLAHALGKVDLDIRVEHLISLAITSITVYYYYLTNHWMLVNLFAVVLCLTVRSLSLVSSYVDHQLRLDRQSDQRPHPPRKFFSSCLSVVWFVLLWYFLGFWYGSDGDSGHHYSGPRQVPLPQVHSYCIGCPCEGLLLLGTRRYCHSWLLYLLSLPLWPPSKSQVHRGVLSEASILLQYGHDFLHSQYHCHQFGSLFHSSCSSMIPSLSLRFVARSALHCPCPPSLHLPGRRDSGRYQEHLRVQRRKTRWEIQIWLDFLFRSFKHNNRSK